ncbi:MAG: hypothetical protein ACRCTJ_03505, partial [Brevinema sp.]
GLLIKKLPAGHFLINITAERYQKIKDLFHALSDDETLTLLNLSLDLCDVLRKETAERFWIESTLFKMLDYKNRIPLSQFRQEILKLIGREPKVNLTKPTISVPSIEKENIYIPSRGALSVALEQQAHTQSKEPIIDTLSHSKSLLPEHYSNQKIEEVIKAPLDIIQTQSKDNDSSDREGLLKNLFEIS